LVPLQPHEKEIFTRPPTDQAGQSGFPHSVRPAGPRLVPHRRHRCLRRAGRVLRDTSREFADRTGVSNKLACVPLSARLPADTELTLCRFLQEALKNIEKRACARHDAVSFGKLGDFVQWQSWTMGSTSIRRFKRPNEIKGRPGLLSMREWAA